MKASQKDILFICQYFYPEYISSATLPFDTAKKLAENGFKVGALVGYPNEYKIESEVPIRESVDGISIKRLKYLTLDKKKKIGRLLNYFSFTFFVLLNIREFKKYKSIIFYSNPPILPVVAVFAKKIFKNKLVFVSYDIYPEIAIKTNILNENSVISKVMRKVNEIAFPYFDKVVSLSTEMKGFLIEKRNIKSKDVVVIPNWYEDKLLKSNQTKNERLLETFRDENVLYVSYFGNMGIAQDLDTIFKAISILKEEQQIKFVFAGHGNKKAQLELLIKQESLNNVVFFDFLHGEDYEYALSRSNILLVSLEKDLAGLAVPSKTYSYMMAGKTIISIMDENTDIARELIDYEAGYNISVGEYHELAKKLIDVSNNKMVLIEKEINCKALFKEKYTTEICTSKYVNLFKELLEEKNV